MEPMVKVSCKLVRMKGPEVAGGTSSVDVNLVEVGLGGGERARCRLVGLPGGGDHVPNE